MQIESAPFGKQCRHICARQVQRNLASAEIVNRDMLTGQLVFQLRCESGGPVRRSDNLPLVRAQPVDTMLR